MGTVLSRRGPDEQTVFDDGHLAFVFRRLSIVAPAGSVPWDARWAVDPADPAIVQSSTVACSVDHSVVQPVVQEEWLVRSVVQSPGSRTNGGRGIE